MPVLVLSFALWNGTAAILPLGLDGLVAKRVGERIADRLMPFSRRILLGSRGVPYPYTLKLPSSVSNRS